MKTPHHQISLSPELKEEIEFWEMWHREFGKDSAIELSSALIRHLSGKCQEYRKKVTELETNQSWVTNPDRMGGSFTAEEINESNTWR
jgi:hypothetical protein